MNPPVRLTNLARDRQASSILHSQYTAQRSPRRILYAGLSSSGHILTAHELGGALSISSNCSMSDHVLIYLNGQRLTVEGDRVFMTLVEFLRKHRGLLGTKVGCGEGDCGACTVMVGRPIDGTLRYRTVSSCLQAMYQLDGVHIVTIEGLTPTGGLGPIQQAMVDHHGSQCGYCTPGMVVALEGIFEAGCPVDTSALRSGLTGNLCRCTGYVPILEAGLAVDRAKWCSSTAAITRAKWPQS